MQRTRKPQPSKARPRANVVGGVVLAKPTARPRLRTYEDVFRYALSRKAGSVRRPEPGIPPGDD
jgi:hypothetical protein